MRLFHTADLHLGKKVNGFNLLEDQKFVLQQIVDLCKKYKPDGLLIAGDIYDTSYPPEGALLLLDEFLTELSDLSVKTFIISGNHDSSKRLAFASRILDKHDIHFITQLSQAFTPFVITDDAGVSVSISAIPYFTYLDAQRVLNENFSDIQSAAQLVFDYIRFNLPQTDFHLAMAHMFISHVGLGPQTSDSERISLGTLENVDAQVFDDFDYVALGHIHRPQKISKETIRYSGSPLMYSFSELGYQKHIMQIDFDAFHDEAILSSHNLQPLHEMREIRGLFADIIKQAALVKDDSKYDYLHIILEDEFESNNVLDSLREFYPNIMILSYDNARTRAQGLQTPFNQEIKHTDYLDLFKDFYAEQNGMGLSDYQSALLEKIYTDSLKNSEGC